MSNFVIDNIRPFGKFEINMSYLLLIAVDNVPPHLALVSNLKYFSLSSSGVKLGVDANVIMNSLKRKNVPTVLLPVAKQVVDDTIKNEYFNYKKLDQGHSCLNPIKSIFATLDNNLLNCKYAFDLIEYMFKVNLFEEAFSLNYPEKDLELTKYGQKEIDLAIYNAAQLC